MVKFMSGNQFDLSKRRSRHQRSRWSLAGFAALFLLAGCGEGPKAEFAPRQSTTDLIRDAEHAVQQVMTESFGTPQAIVAWERLPVNYGGAPGAEGAKSATAGEEPSVGFGSQMQSGRTVYMKNCMHCHGVAGDGAGPTAKYLNPRPRDYRLGIFKFTSTLNAERATRDDLHRIVKNGIPGTYMPSFLLMKDDEATAVVEYVRWLAMRGEMEKRLGDELSDYNEPSIRADVKSGQAAYAAAVKGGEKPEKPQSESQALAVAKASFEDYRKEQFDGVVDETANFLAETWQRAEEEGSLILPKVARVEDSPESRLRGRVLYMSNRTKCYTCHGPQGRGDGGAVEDFWPKPGTSEKYAQRGLHDLWGQKLQPRDLTRNQYRGGRRPLDLYRRVFAGIKGTPMPAFGGTVLKDDEIWDLVNYVMSVPFESQTPATPRPAAMAAKPQESDKDH